VTKKATALTPQVVTLIIDDSNSMEGTKAKAVTEAVQDFVLTLHQNTQDSMGFRYLVNIAKFGDSPIPLIQAKAPLEIEVPGVLTFSGDSGYTDMPLALNWTKEAVEAALGRCRAITGYSEQSSPNPLCVFFSDGENTGGDVAAPARALRSVNFNGGQVDVVACGIELQPKDEQTMRAIASDPNLFINISFDKLVTFIADIGKTRTINATAEQLTRPYAAETRV
jgi:uncharacterized protein YegL